MKLRVPNGCSEVSHAGRVIEILDDGSVRVDDDAREVLVSHGFTLWEDKQERGGAAVTTRDQLITPEMDMATSEMESIETEDIHTMATATDAAALPDGNEDPGANNAISDAVD